MTVDQHTLDFYVQPAMMTSAGRYAALLDGLPHDIASLVGVAQGLLLHEHIAPAYGVTLSDERRSSVPIRPVEQLLERLVKEDDRPLTNARTPETRLAGNCRHFTVLMVAMLRSQGVPARARCGFGGYFGTNSFEDHWVCEYWNTSEARWVLVDAQIDDLQKGMFQADFDLMDVPRAGFLIAEDAWAQCRAGDADPAKFGLSMLNEAGDWWIAGNLLRDVAALNNMEMLPWDVWGAMPAPNEPITDDHLALFDRLATRTQNPDASFAELHTIYEDDMRLHVPPTVFNAVLNRIEPI
ncbi:MAG: transglutaminase-like domain-containing protein [Roseiflexaceae bacterium]|nr:transglutaminase-like domain-containing protein [Roseiflexaceae bacterium]